MNKAIKKEFGGSIWGKRPENKTKFIYKNKNKKKRYVIEDLQFNGRLFADGAEFKNKKEILIELASFHDIDYSGVKDNDEPYKDIFEFLNTLKNDEARLKWILEYGEWEIVEVK